MPIGSHRALREAGCDTVCRSPPLLPALRPRIYGGLPFIVAVLDLHDIIVPPDVFLPFTGLFHTDQTIFRVILVVCYIAFGTFGTGNEAVFVQISRVSIRVIRIVERN